jgi:hypothetical protein
MINFLTAQKGDNIVVLTTANSGTEPERFNVLKSVCTS